MSFSAVLERTLRSWRASEAQYALHLQKIPEGFRSLFELQRNIQNSGMGIHIGCAAVESLNQSIRKLQQLGGGS